MGRSNTIEAASDATLMRRSTVHGYRDCIDKNLLSLQITSGSNKLVFLSQESLSSKVQCYMKTRAVNKVTETHKTYYGRNLRFP